LNSDEKSNHYPLVRRPASAVEKAAPGAKRIVAGMVADALSLVKKTRPRRIVVVNDEEMLIKSIQFILRECFNLDSTVLTFDDSEKAWQELLRTDPDLLITDDIMPALGGMEIVRRLANRKAAYPVILTTSFERTELLMCMRDCASRGLKIKLLNAPWDLESFLKAVEDSLKISRAIARPDAETPPIIANADSESWFEKGNSYFESENYTKAVRWYRKAAGQNHAQAQYVLGCCYEDGDGVPQNYTEAAKWYHKAAEQNHAEAQLTLGSCYRRGQGVPQNMVEAVQWYRKAAEQGDADAQYSLGMCYQDGQGVVKDEAEAEKWQNKAREIWRKKTEDRLAVADPQLESWFQTGEKYYFGHGVPKDYAEALKWYRKAAKHGHALAQNSVGAFHERGYGVPKDYKEAVKWYRKAAEQGEAYAQNNLGACYANGIGVSKDRTEAVKWYRKAAEQGNLLAKTNLGLLNEKGDGALDYPAAVESCRKMADQGFAPAQYNLGVFYRDGEGVAKDYAEAVKWFRKAAEQGHLAAQESLGACYANGRAAIAIEDVVDAYKYVKLAEEKGYEGAAKTVDVITVLLSPEELREAERRYQELRSRRSGSNTEETAGQP
jgi:TPR repeat protein